MSGPLVAIASFQALPGLAAEALSRLEPLIEMIHSEAGCELYALHEAEEGRFVLIEKWASQADADRHGQLSPVLPILAEKLTPLLTGPPEIVELHPHPIGSTGRGAL